MHSVFNDHACGWRKKAIFMPLSLASQSSGGAVKVEDGGKIEALWKRVRDFTVCHNCP